MSCEKQWPCQEAGRKGERAKGRKGEKAKGRKGERAKGRKGERAKRRKGSQSTDRLPQRERSSASQAMAAESSALSSRI